MRVLDTNNMKVDGIFKDVIRKNGKVVAETEWKHNLVVQSVTKLIAALVGGKMTSGNLYWAVGSGDASWSADGADVKPTLGETQLTNEIGRKKISDESIEFYTADNKPVAEGEISNRLHITAMFNENECNGDWREFGLFGGDDASVMVNTGIMIDKKHHGLISKTEETTVERHLILTFNLVATPAEGSGDQGTEPDPVPSTGTDPGITGGETTK